MIKNTTRLCFVFMALFGVGQARANNVAITGLSYLAGSDQIRFNITWDNSWRNTATSGSTQNYDGVWVFVKFRNACAKDSVFPSASDYMHMWLSTNVSDHIAPAGSSLDVGTTNISGTPRGMGVFIYRNADGTGTVNYSNVTLKWAKADQGISGTDWDIQVFAIEMVKIPQGSFALGDGTSSASLPNISYGEYRSGIRDEPYLVSTEDSIPSNTLYYRNGSSGSNAVPALSANTPKGYSAFWCMKYEITQKQVCDFLNTLSRESQYKMQRNINLQAQFTLGDTSLNDNLASNDNARLGFFIADWAQQRTYRNGITVQNTLSGVNRIVSGSKPWSYACDLNNNGIYNEATDGMNTACNFLNASFLYAYLDWSALRPMNELEYEKVCRGPSTVSPFLPQADALVWGLVGTSSNITALGTSYSSAGTSSEVPTTAVSAIGQVVAGDAGPRRVGCTNRTGSTREASGSAFYGVANMAGNVDEIVIRIGYIYNYTRDCQVNYYRNSYGDGNILSSCARESSSCPADYDRWPIGWYCHVGGNTIRGGNFSTSSYERFGISNRTWCGICSYMSTSSTWVTSSVYPDANTGATSILDVTYLSNGIYDYSTSANYTYLSQIGGRGVR